MRMVRVLRLHILGRDNYIVVCRKIVPTKERATAMIREFYPDAECDYIAVMT